jgi:hypothetical protein
MPSSLRKSAVLAVALAATACSSTRFEHFISIDPPDASVYINGTRQGKGDRRVHEFDFTNAQRVWVQAVHPDFRSEARQVTQSELERTAAARTDITISLGARR